MTAKRVWTTVPLPPPCPYRPTRFRRSPIRRKAAKIPCRSDGMAAIERWRVNGMSGLPMGMPFPGAVIKAGATTLLFCHPPRGSEWTLTTIRSGDDPSKTVHRSAGSNGLA